MSKLLLYLRFCLGTLTFLLPQALLAQSWQWAVAPLSVGTGSSTITASVRDQAGNLVVAGNFQGVLTLGSFTLTSGTATSTDLFIARLTPAGTWLAASSAPVSTKGTVSPVRLAVQADGTVVVGGSFRGTTAQFGSTTLTNAGPVNPASINVTTSDLFVARWNSGGQWTQAVRAGGTREEELRALVVDATGNVVIGGGFSSQNCQFGTYALNNIDDTALASPDLFVAHLNAAGTWTQAVGAGSTGSEYVTGLTVERDGTVNLIATFAGYTLRLGTTLLYNNSYNTGSGFTSTSMLFARLSAAGTWSTVLQPAATSEVYATDILADSNGDLVIGGMFSARTVQFGNVTLTNSDNTARDIFVARLSEVATTPTWTQAVRAGSRGDDQLNQLALDGQGNVLITGKFTGTITTLGNFTLTNAATIPNTRWGDVLVARLSRAGMWTQALQAGGPADDSGASVTSDATGSTVLVAGTVTNPASFGSIVLPGTAATSSGFIARVGALPLALTASRTAAALAIYPNPALTTARLVLPTAAATARTVAVLDAVGQVVYSQPVSAGVTWVDLPLADLRAGWYVVRCGEASGSLLVR
jgi:hypothetical protein